MDSSLLDLGPTESQLLALLALGDSTAPFPLPSVCWAPNPRSDSLLVQISNRTGSIETSLERLAAANLITLAHSIGENPYTAQPRSFSLVPAAKEQITSWLEEQNKTEYPVLLQRTLRDYAEIMPIHLELYWGSAKAFFPHIKALVNRIEDHDSHQNRADVASPLSHSLDFVALIIFLISFYRATSEFKEAAECADRVAKLLESLENVVDDKERYTTLLFRSLNMSANLDMDVKGASPDTLAKFEKSNSLLKLLGDHCQSLSLRDRVYFFVGWAVCLMREKNFPESNTKLTACFELLGISSPQQGLEESKVPSDPDAAELLGSSLQVYGSYLRFLNQVPQAEVFWTRAFVIKSNAVGRDHPRTQRALLKLAEHKIEMGENDEAATMLNEFVAVWSKGFGRGVDIVAYALRRLSELYILKEDLDNARVVLDEAHASLADRLGPTHEMTLVAFLDKYHLEAKAGNLEKVLQIVTEYQSLVKERLGVDSVHYARSLIYLAEVLADSLRLKEVLAMESEILTRCEKAFGPKHFLFLSGLKTLAQCHIDIDDYEPAVALLRRLVENDPDCTFGNSHFALAALLEKAGQDAESERVYTDLISVMESKMPTEPNQLKIHLTDLANTYSALAMVAAKLGYINHCDALLKKSFDILSRLYGPDEVHFGRWYARRAMMMGHSGRMDDFFENANEALRIFTAALGKDHSETLQLQEDINRVKDSLGSAMAKSAERREKRERRRRVRGAATSRDVLPLAVAGGVIAICVALGTWAALKLYKKHD